MNLQKLSKLNRQNLHVAWHISWRALLISSLATTLAWWRYQILGEHSLNDDEEMIVFLLVSLIACYVAVIGPILVRAQEKREALEKAIAQNNLNEFIANINKEVYFALEFAVFTIAVLTYGTFLLLVFNSVWSGVVGAFVMWMIFTVLRQSGWVLDNPLDGPAKLPFTSPEQARNWTSVARGRIKEWKDVWRAWRIIFGLEKEDK